MTGILGQGKGNKNAEKEAIYSAIDSIYSTKLDGRRSEVKQMRNDLANCAADLGGWDNLSRSKKILLKNAMIKNYRCRKIAKQIVLLQESGQEVPEHYTHDFLRWSHSLRDDLRLLGLERASKDTDIDLKEYLRRKAEQKQQQQS